MLRIGIDLVEIARLARSLSRSSFLLQRTFSETELQAAGQLGEARRHEYLAGRFAVKEAVLKALHLGIEDVTKMKEIEVLSEPDGSPRVRLAGSVARIASKNGLSDWQVSISHDAGVAAAFVLLS
jgi:holo-[acyl-carrier protein] synthase